MAARGTLSLGVLRRRCPRSAPLRPKETAMPSLGFPSWATQ